jgi:hypothetical protein
METCFRTLFGDIDLSGQFSQKPTGQKTKPVNFEVGPVKIENHKFSWLLDFSNCTYIINVSTRYLNCDI